MHKDPYQIAKKRVAAKKGFYQHLAIFVIINVFLVALNIITQYGHRHIHWWCLYPLLGWGVSVAIHYTAVFGVPFTRTMDEDWEEREIQKEIQKIHRKNNIVPPAQHDNKQEFDEELELKEFKKLRKEWDDQDFV